jgi:hypothetical protein
MALLAVAATKALPLKKRLAAMICLSLSVWLALAAAAVTIEDALLLTDTSSIVALGATCYACIGCAGLAACFRPWTALPGRTRSGGRPSLLAASWRGRPLWSRCSWSAVNGGVGHGIGLSGHLHDGEPGTARSAIDSGTCTSISTLPAFFVVPPHSPHPRASLLPRLPSTAIRN